MAKPNKTPAVLSFQRLMLVTDGAFYNQIDGEHEAHPLQVIRHGIRGTQNTDNTEKNVANIQVTESAKLDARAQALVVTFGVRMLDLHCGLFACLADTKERTREVKKAIYDFAERAKGSESLVEVSRRIARNIASGSWLWRNRTVASEIEIIVTESASGKTIATFDALKVPCSQFDNYSEGELALAKVLADGLRGAADAAVQVKAVVKFGVTGSVEVFPSQAYIEDKPKGFARPLYKISPAKDRDEMGVQVMGQAALRDQKIGNRLRAFDTWYPDYDLVGKPLPIEPNAASLEFGEAFRHNASSAFSLFADLAAVKPGTDLEMYCIGMLIRGGVLGKSDKKDKQAAATTEEASAE